MSERSPNSGGAGRLLRQLRIEPGELRPTLLLGAFLMLGMATVICLKALSDSIFLSEFNATKLPYVDLVVTALVGLTVNYYLRWSARVSQGALVASTHTFLAANLTVFWLLLKFDVAWAPILIYVWVGIFAVLIPSQAWSLAGSLFTTRQAKRLFAIIGSGGILGAALGGNFAGYVGPRIGTEAVLPATVVFVGIAAWIARSLTRMGTNAAVSTPAPESEGQPIVESFRLVRENRYLLLIALVIFASTIAGTLVKYQFKAIAQIEFAADRDALTSFTGYFYGYIAVVSFLFHVVFTGRLMRWIGLGGSLFVLPLALMGGMGVLLGSTALAAGIFARGVDQGFRHSVDRASLELLYVPVPAALRSRVKSFIDMVGSRAADGVASLALLAVLNLVSADPGRISWIGLGVGVIWLALLWQLKAAYVTTLRGTIERPDISADALLQSLADSGPSQELESSLHSSDQRDVEAAVGWIQFAGGDSAQAQLASLLRHEAPAIRRKAMGVVAARDASGCEKEALAFVHLENDLDLRRQALEYVEGQAPEFARAAEEGLLENDDDELAALAAARLSTSTGVSASVARRAREVFSAKLAGFASGGPSERTAAAKLLALAPAAAEYEARLARLLEDDDPEVVRAAIDGCRNLRPLAQAPRLIEFLGDRRYGKTARRSLAAYGEPVVAALNDALRSPRSSLALRRRAARVIGAIGGRRGSRALLAYLRRSHLEARPEVLRALSRLRARTPTHEFDREIVTLLLESALRRYYQAAVRLDGLGEQQGEASAFLRRALTERGARWLDEAFALLGLIYPQREIRDAYQRIRSGRSELRANALEFLDSRLLGSPLRPMLLPALEERNHRRILAAGREHFVLELYDGDTAPYASVLRRLLDASDPWLQSCACFAAAESRRTELEPRIADLRGDEDPILRESAEAAWRRMREAQSA